MIVQSDRSGKHGDEEKEDENAKEEKKSATKEIALHAAPNTAKNHRRGFIPNGAPAKMPEKPTKKADTDCELFFLRTRTPFLQSLFFFSLCLFIYPPDRKV